MVPWVLPCVPCRLKRLLENILSCIVWVDKVTNQSKSEWPAARRGFMRHAAGACALAAWGPALAQFRVEVSGIGVTQLPIALPVFRGEASAPQKISSIVRADLERSGVFRSADAAGVVACRKYAIGKMKMDDLLNVLSFNAFSTSSRTESGRPTAKRR